MRKITADYIFPANSLPIKNGVITVSDDGIITEISDNSDTFNDIESYKGIIVPGFVNTHCHLELSHMKGKIDKHTGLFGFIGQFIASRPQLQGNNIKKSIEIADKEMYDNGIVAVGDISNTSDSFDTKSTSKIKYYTFIEVFDSLKYNDDVLNNAKLLKSEITDRQIGKSSIVPHAPYSVSEELFRQIAKLNNTVTSIHNQESEDENQLYKSKSGHLFDLFQRIKVDFSHFEPSGKNSLPTILKFFPKDNKIILVHNTYTNSDDIAQAVNYFDNSNLYLSICINANLYIENNLPDLNAFSQNEKLNDAITIGTDSYASNNTLSTIEELKTISANFPSIPLETLIKWATINGAKALNFEDNFGSFEVGKTPSVILIENINNLKLTTESCVKRIV